MPCMGPDCDAARRNGREVAEKMLADMIEQHDLFDVTHEQYRKLASGTIFCGINLPGCRERWTAAKHAFVRAVEELFVEDACNNF